MQWKQSPLPLASAAGFRSMKLRPWHSQALRARCSRVLTCLQPCHARLLLSDERATYSEDARSRRLSQHPRKAEGDQMHRNQILVAFTACTLAIAAARAQKPAAIPVPETPRLPQAARTAAGSIDPEKIRAHVRFLSLDLLEGRGPGTRGGELAAEYIATQFALAGVAPAGDDGTYFQRVPLYAVHTVEDKTKFSFVPADGAALDLAYGDEIVAKDQTGQATAEIDAPIVFVGYGIDAPEYNWNDYAGADGKDIDVKGKVVLVILNEPPSQDAKFFKGTALTYYGRCTYKYEEAARRGAVGVL